MECIWSKIIRVISKSDERAGRVPFEIASMISDQNCTTRSSITTYECFIHLVAGLQKRGNKKAFTSHSVFETEIMRYRPKMVRFKTEMTRFRAKNNVIRE